MFLVISRKIFLCLFLSVASYHDAKDRETIHKSFTIISCECRTAGVKPYTNLIIILCIHHKFLEPATFQVATATVVHLYVIKIMMMYMPMKTLK